MNAAEVKRSLEQLGLQSAAATLERHLETATRLQVTYLEFLSDLLASEQLERRARYLAARTRLANLPFKKTLADFDFSFQPSIDERQIRELATLGFVHQAANVLFLGPPGVGKTHLAVALGLTALEEGYSVYFTSAHRMIQDLAAAHQENRLRRRLRLYLAPKVLIIDEIGYEAFPPAAATLFFQVVSARYEKASIILTSNKSFSEWGDILGDPVVATAILDRLLHHAHVVNIRGESYRLRERKASGLYMGPTLRLPPPAGQTAPLTEPNMAPTRR
ncbi:MAG: ATP-binding protein [Clostridia bacterium]|nr:ATP-binding protein [Clostridia bacterium]